MVNSQTAVFRLISLLCCTEMPNSACVFFAPVLPIIFGAFILADLGPGMRLRSRKVNWLICVHASQVDGSVKV